LEASHRSAVVVAVATAMPTGLLVALEVAATALAAQVALARQGRAIMVVVLPLTILVAVEVVRGRLEQAQLQRRLVLVAAVLHRASMERL
jgi:hypothetical protein